MQGSLAKKLRILRAERAMSLTDAAEATGVQRQTLADLERGARRPHDPTLVKIARGYGVPFEELLELEPETAGLPKAAASYTGQPEVEPGQLAPGDVIYSAGLGRLDEDELRSAMAYVQERLPSGCGLAIDTAGFTIEVTVQPFKVVRGSDHTTEATRAQLPHA